ncbi:tetratricopeptide repeat protein [Pandoraea pneumonica]|uniref:tetratricopeptide repeat protein n=1 Tax=Pandoraea pneumonica TaxID=2508299 RepID=UPI003CEF62F9
MAEQSSSVTPDAQRPERLERLLGYLKADPGNDALRADAFDVALATGHWSLAQGLLDEVPAQQRVAPLWTYRAGMLALAHRNWDAAEAVFTGLREASGDNAALVHNLAYIAFQRADYARVEALLSPLLDAEDADDATRALWLRAAHRAFHFTEALERVRRWQAVGVLGPQAAGVASLIAVDAASFPEITPWAQYALQQLPSQPEALVALGSMALGQQQGEQAKQCFGAALDKNPEEGRAWSGLGFALLMLQQAEASRDAFARAVHYMPTHIGTWHGKGWAALTSQMMADARADFDHALELDRNFAESHGAVAVVACMEGREADAQAAIERALRLDPACVGANFARALLNGEMKDVEALRKMSNAILTRQARLFRGESTSGAASKE